MATVDYRRDTSFGKKMNSTPLKRFLSFLPKVMATYPTGKLALVLDNAGFIMQSCFGRFWKRKKIGLSLCTCLHTALQLNIVEGLWKWLKSSVINNVFYSAVSEIRLRVGQFMDEIMKHPHAIIDRLCVRL
ncbi:transposase [Paenibacillus larvae]|nr:transposase [Paenibacillus larvae]